MDDVRQAVVVVVVKEDRVLVIRRGPAALRPGYWAPPSGRIEPGESQAEAVVREIYEEVGLVVTPLEKVWECPTDDGTFRLHWWAVEAEPGELKLDPDEVADAAWIDPDEFSLLEPTFEGDREFFASVWPALRETRA